MKKICKEKLPLERFELAACRGPQADGGTKDEPYKVQLIDDLPEDATISFYKQGRSSPTCAPARTWIRPAASRAMASS